MFNELKKRSSVLFVAAAVVLSQVLMPVNAAFASSSPNHNDAEVKPDSPSSTTPLSPKVWVCKYTRTPGEGERAHNVISVDWNQSRWPGMAFNDAQGASYVFGWDFPGNFDPKPSIYDCPSITLLPTNPPLNDPCGAGNASWIKPANTNSITWLIGIDGSLIAIATPGHMFNDATFTHNYGKPVETNVAPCTTEIPIPIVPIIDRCGLANAVYGEVTPGNYSVLRNTDGSITLTALSGYVFTGGMSSVTLPTPVDSGQLCQIPVPPKPEANDPCGLNNASWTKPTDTTEVIWSLNDNNELIASAIGVTFDDMTTVHNYGVAVDNGKLCEVAIPEAPRPADPCGLNNASWGLPADTDEITWQIVDGHLISTTTADFSFSDGTFGHDYGLAIDSQLPCFVEPIDPADIVFTDLCGTAQDSVTLPADTESVHYKKSLMLNGVISVTATAQPGYAFMFDEDQESIVTEIVYAIEFTNLACGIGNITPQETPKTTPSVVTELPHTGVSTDGLIFALVASLTTYGAVYFAQGKRRYI